MKRLAKLCFVLMGKPQSEAPRPIRGALSPGAHHPGTCGSRVSRVGAGGGAAGRAEW